MYEEKLLEVKNLHISFDTYIGEIKAVRGVDFNVKKGETLAIVGESGCGKSVTAQSLMKLIPEPPGKYKNGEIIFNGKNILKLSKKKIQKMRGSEIGLILQDPLTSLNPTMTVGKQIAESLIKHQKIKKNKAIDKAIEMLKVVGIPNPEKRAMQYPHEFSGGMRQRVVIAIALACNPKLLIADEPTTALDVTIQAQILELMKELQKKFETSIIMITHDLGVVAELADNVMIMYAGKIVERGNVDQIFYSPSHPYTWGLLGSIPRLNLENKQKLMSIKGTPPDLLMTIKGCPFKDRCAYAMDICEEEYPEEIEISNKHTVNCWLQHEYAPKVINPITLKEARENDRCTIRD